MINIFSSNEENKKINKDKLNIAFFTDTYLPQINGVSVSVHTLSKELSKNGHNVYVFCPKIKDRDNKDENIIEFISIPFIPYPEHKISMLEVWKAHKYVKKYNIDIIHTHTEFSIGIMGRLTARLLNIPLIYTYHTMYEACIDHVKIKNFEILKPEYARTFSRRFCNFSDYVVAPTKKIHELLNDYGVRKHIKVIPTGINLENFSNVLERDKKQLIEKYSLENKTILSYIGRVSLEKRVDVIVRALKELIKIDKNYHLIIVGDGPDIDKNKQLANDLNLTDFITFVGRVKPEEVALYYNVSDAYISGSLSETQGLTFLEAMASNTPVLASEYTLKDLLIDNETAMLFKTEEDLVGKILKLKDENFKNKLL